MAKINPFTDISNKSLPSISNTIGGSSYLSNLKKMSVGSGSQVVRADQSGLWAGGNKFAGAPFSVDMQGNVILSSATVSGYIGTGGAAGDVNAYAVTIDGGKITANTITSNQILTNSLVVGTHVQIGTAQDASGVTTIIGDTVTTGYVNALSITTANLNASMITAGTLTVGGTNQPGAIIIQESSLTGNSRLGWQRGSRMWEDSSSRLGINSLGSPMYIYVASSQRIIIPSSGQTTIEGGANLKGNLNVQDDAKISGQLKLSYDNIDFSVDASTVSLAIRNHGLTSYKSGANRAGLSWGNGANFEVDASGPWYQINGNAKSAIVPTSKGYKALYCIESPEVWFMDFVDELEKEDPIFKEVTTGKVKIIEVMGGGYQIWRRRRGHEYKRFENKTTEEFIKNEKFLMQPKVIN